MVFPVATYGGESWTINEAEHSVVLERLWQWLYNIVIYLTPVNCALTHGLNDQFYVVYIITTIFKIKVKTM